MGGPAASRGPSSSGVNTDVARPHRCPQDSHTGQWQLSHPLVLTPAGHLLQEALHLPSRPRLPVLPPQYEAMAAASRVAFVSGGRTKDLLDGGKHPSLVSVGAWMLISNGDISQGTAIVPR
jgi:hypothetical protein